MRYVRKCSGRMPDSRKGEASLSTSLFASVLLRSFFSQGAYVRKYASVRILAPTVAAINPRTAQLPRKEADAFYLSPEWRSCVARIKAKRGLQCEACGATGTRIFGDHVTELQDGGAALNEQNIRLLCGKCHGAKTCRVRAERTAAQHVRI